MLSIMDSYVGVSKCLCTANAALFVLYTGKSIAETLLHKIGGSNNGCVAFDSASRMDAFLLHQNYSGKGIESVTYKISKLLISAWTLVNA